MARQAEQTGVEILVARGCEGGGHGADGLLSITAGLTAVVMATGLSDSIHKLNHSAVQGLGQVQPGFNRSSQQLLFSVVRSNSLSGKSDSFFSL